MGSVRKGKPEVDGNGQPLLDEKGNPVRKPDYIVLNNNKLSREALIKALANLNDDDDGLIINLESKQQQLASLDRAVASGKLDARFANMRKEQINKIPDYVRFNLVLKNT